MDEITLYEWFRRSAELNPDSVALQIRGMSHTYGDLVARSDALAKRILYEFGDAPRRVGLLANRSLSAYVGYLAVLRLGGAVVPLNPQYPIERNLGILEDARAPLVVADSSVMRTFSAESMAAWPMLVDSDGSVSTTPRSDGIVLPDQPTDVDGEAYLVFTSGSQGRPKGVAVTHRQISTFLSTSIRLFEVEASSRFSQFFNLTFDASVGDLFISWGAGATLVVPTARDLLDPIKFIVDEQLSHWFSVPSAVRVADAMGMLSEGPALCLRHSMFGAEPVMVKHMARWREVAPSTAIWNMYGPTEAAITCVIHGIPAASVDWGEASNGTLPIGAAYPGTELAIVGPDGRPTEDGELVIRGKQRFDGYIDAEDNRGRFGEIGVDGTLRDIDGAPGERSWYRTGDRVAIERGLFVHRGRLDQQVKVRGHRVELGEIEAAMLSHPEVSDAAVIVDPGVTDEVSLVGFFVGTAGLDDVRGRLRDRLPDYMMPADMVQLERLPLNSNGKIDRGSLRHRRDAQSPASSTNVGEGLVAARSEGR